MGGLGIAIESEDLVTDVLNFLVFPLESVFLFLFLFIALNYVFFLFLGFGVGDGWVTELLRIFC
jgi:hypothetical protein